MRYSSSLLSHQARFNVGGPEDIQSTVEKLVGVGVVEDDSDREFQWMEVPLKFCAFCQP